MSSAPLVTCICPTRNRRIYVRRALEYYRRAADAYAKQMNGRTEFVIVDSSDEPTHYRDADYYIPLPAGLVDQSSSWVPSRHGSPANAVPSFASNCGEARNVACDVSRGQIIIHWDDDDWQSPDRIVRQVKALLAVPGGLTYSSSFYWYHVAARRACRSRTWNIGGGTMGCLGAYWRDAWKAVPFPDGGSEDVVFMREHVERKTPVVDSMDPSLLVYVRHGTNYSALTHYDFTDEATDEARQLIGGDVSFYDDIAQISQLFEWNRPNAPGARVQVRSPLEQVYLRHFR